MNILVAAGGDPEQWPNFLEQQYDIYVGVDRGGLYLLDHGWPLNLAVGDFDSMDSLEKRKVESKAMEVLPSRPEKDDTDTQLALESVFQRWPQAQVTLIGATGGRLDHLLANIWLGLEARFRPYSTQIQLADKQNHLKYYLPGEHIVQQVNHFKYLAYCCLTPVTELTLMDSKYLLDHVEVRVPTSYASNEFLKEQAKFSFTSGMIAVIQSKD